MKRRVFIPILCCLLLGLGAVMAHAAPSVTISDSKVTILEAVTDAILEEVKKGVGGKEVEFELRNIDSNEDLTKICASFPGIKTLSIFGRQNLTSVAPIAALKQLQSLDLSASSVVDFSSLSTLTGLTSLKISSVIMGPDLKWMNGLTNLKTLAIVGGKNLVSFEGLPSLPQLTQAKFDKAYPADLTPLVEALPGLKSLDLRGSTITDLTPLSGLANLEKLSLYGATVKDFSPLGRCASLRNLDFYNAKGVDHSTMGKLAQVTTLQGGQTSMQDISWVAGLSNLTQLTLSQENITDYSPLAKRQLEFLAITDMKAEAVDLGFLSGMTSLKRLNLRGLNGVSNLKALQNLTSLTSLAIVKLTLKDGETIPLDQIKKFPNLRGFNVSKGIFTEGQLTGFAHPKITVRQE